MRKMLASFLDVVHLKMEVNRLFEAIHGLQGNDLWEMDTGNPYDVIETPNAIIVKVELPGADRESLKIDSNGQDLEISGDRKRYGSDDIVAYHQMERERGPFVLNMHIDGPFDPRGATAGYSSGVLSINLPRLHERRGSPTKIPVEE